MIKINLLPYVEKKKVADVKRQVIIILSSFVVFLLIIASLHIHVARSISKLEKEIEVAENQLRVLTRLTGNLEKFKNDKIILKKKLAIIENLEKSRLDPVLFLDDLAMMVPEKSVWLTALSESGTNLKMDGVAKDNSTIADFMRNLERSQFIKSVDLISSKQIVISGIRLKEFTLLCTMKKG